MAGKVAGLALVVGLLGWVAAPATAGGGRMSPVQERYEPGGVATLVGYTGGPALDAELVEETFYAYLRPTGDGSRSALDDAGIYVGELVLEETAHGGYLQLRVSLTFDVPRALPPADYEVTYCEDPCRGRFLGDLLPSLVSIGVDPARRVVREWALDEPEIANLAAGALLVGPDFHTTAGQLRAPAPPAPVAPPAAAAPDPVAEPSSRPAPVRLPATDEMDWQLPSVLVVASAAATALVLGRRQRTAAVTPGR